MAKLILYQVKSPYPGDVTKNCALTGKEVDNNFLNLKGEDIEKIYLDEETKKLTFTRFKNGIRNCNGEQTKAEIEIDLTELEYVVGYKYEEGVIKILYSNGKTAEMPIEAFGMAVATDSTISGNGSKSNPLTLSQAIRPGQYQPVFGIIDTTEGELLPETGLVNGEGYVTREIKSKFGLFYTSDQALKLQELLMLDNSEWRVPEKEDWDGLLNHLEECDKYKNHSLRSKDSIDARGMKLGNLAGFKAKSLDTDDTDYWRRGGRDNGDELRIYPTGSFSALSGEYSGFGDDAQFWTITEGDVSCRNFYSKKFFDCVGTVTQIEEMPAAKLTIRLVKDFLGENYNQFEDILGRMYETKLFASEADEYSQVWTMVNIDIQDPESGLIPTPMPESATTAITSEYAYYVNRWNGKRWDKHEMVDGDCIVVIPSGVSEDMAEYRLEHGELVNRDDFWQEQLDDISAITEDLQTQIYDEVSARTEADEELHDMITAETQAREEEDERLNNLITAETEAREEADDRIKTAVGLDENGNYIPKSGTTYLDDAMSVEEEIASLNDGLTEEVKEREDADRELHNKIGKPSDIPTKPGNEYTDEDFEEGRITVFGYINAGNDYGYNQDE